MASQVITFQPHELLQPGAGEPVRVQWLGAAGFRVSHGDCSLWIDPFLTRPSLPRCIARRVASDREVVARHVDRADAVLVGHTHLDHALDVPWVARLTGADVYGSWSAARLCHAQGVADGQVHVVEREAGAEPVQVRVGPFEVRFVPSRHAKMLAGRVPFAGEIEQVGRGPLRASEYRCGTVFVMELRVAGRLIVHVGSAAVDRGESEAQADLVLLCASGWRASPRLPETLVERYGPRAVLLSHWDDFFRGLEEPVRELPRVGMDELARRLGDRKVGKVGLLQTIQV